MQAMRLELPIGVLSEDLDLDLWIEEFERARKGDELLERAERDRIDRAVSVKMISFEI